MTHKQQNVLVMLLGSLVLGILTDVLVRQQIFGLNFLIWSLVWVVAIATGAYVKKIYSKLLALQLLIVAINSSLVFVRSEPIVQFWSVVLTFVFLGLSFGRVYITGFEKLGLFAKSIEWLSSGVIALGSVLSELKKSGTSAPRAMKPLSATIGIAVSIPLVLIFISLFASSDEVFRNSFSWLGDGLEAIANFLDKFDIARLITVGFWSVLSLSWIGVIVYRRRSPVQIDIGLPKAMGTKDVTVVLGSIVAVFAFYILIQLRYLFGGSSLPDGLTYAMYARRGYGELLVVTLLASAVIYLAKTLAKDTKSTLNKSLSVVLLLLNSLVIVSAWKRLSLYEDAYGWTMTRFVARMGLICILLGSVSLFIWLRGYISTARLYRFNWYIVTAVLMMAAIMNPVGLVTERNLLDRSEREVSLDVVHLLSQSPDSYGAICSNAQILRNAHPEEYRALVDRKSNGIDFSYSWHSRDNTAFSAHYTNGKNFKTKYHNCLP